MTKTIKKELLFIAAIITAVAICLILMTGNVHAATNAPGGAVKNTAQLNAALDGGHTISGHTVILKDDVQLGTACVSIKSADTSLSIDMNGHSLTATEAKELIYVDSSVVHLTGNGTFIGSKNGKGIAIMLGGAGNLTVDNGTFRAKDAVKVNSSSTSNKRKIYLTVNGGDLGKYSVGGGYHNTVYLTVNGGKLGEVNLSEVELGNRTFGERHKIYINGGTVGQIAFYTDEIPPSYRTMDLYLNGGTVVGTAIVRKAFIKGGKIKGLISVGDVKISGGKIIGRVDAYAFNMSGGNIVCEKKRNAVIVYGKATMTGGTIKTMKKGARGVAVLEGPFYFYGGNIISQGGNGSAGIHVAGEPGHFSYVYFRHRTTKTNSYIKGFKYGMYRNSVKYTRAVLKPYTRLVAKKTRKTAYRAGQKLPRILKGDIKLKTQW